MSKLLSNQKYKLIPPTFLLGLLQLLQGSTLRVIQPKLFVHSNNFMLWYSFYHCAAWVQPPEGSCCHKYHLHLNYLSHEVASQNHQRLHSAERVTGVPHHVYIWFLCNTWCSLVVVHCQWSILYCMEEEVGGQHSPHICGSIHPQAYMTGNNTI